MNYIAHADLDAMRNVAWHIKLVKRESIPSPELIERYKKYADLTISPNTYKDWHCLLFKTRGGLDSYHKGLEHMIDSSSFLADGLLCEWAYIINLDTNNLEVYRGLNKNQYAIGRYSGWSVRHSRGYFGVRLVAEVPFNLIKNSDIDEFAAILEVTRKL